MVLATVAAGVGCGPPPEEGLVGTFTSDIVQRETCRLYGGDEDANELCICSAENIAQVSTEKNKKLENLATVMTLYSRRTFSKESFQWTK